MTKEDKQIIDRATKEEWRIGDRTRLKRLLEKNLEQYRDKVELEEENNKLLDVINNQDVKIADLEKENAELRNNGFTVSAMTEQQLKVALEKGEQLEKENAELKGRNEGFEQQIMGLLIKYEEVYKRFPDLKSAMDKAQTILKENAELKGLKDVATLIRANNDTVVTLMQLNNMLVSRTNQLTKAKELLTKWVELFKPKGGNIPPTPIQVDTEQFLKEIEK